jgi:hypothetical protein
MNETMNDNIANAGSKRIFIVFIRLDKYPQGLKALNY